MFQFLIQNVNEQIGHINIKMNMMKVTVWNNYKFNMNKLHVSQFRLHHQKLTRVNHFCAPSTFIFVLTISLMVVMINFKNVDGDMIL